MKLLKSLQSAATLRWFFELIHHLGFQVVDWLVSDMIFLCQIVYVTMKLVWMDSSFSINIQQLIKILEILLIKQKSYIMVLGFENQFEIGGSRM